MSFETRDGGTLQDLRDMLVRWNSKLQEASSIHVRDGGQLQEVWKRAKPGTNVASYVPTKARNLIQSIPDCKTDYKTIDYTHLTRSDDLTQAIVDASKQNALAYVGTGDYEMHTELTTGTYDLGSVAGVVGDDSGSCNIYYVGLSDNGFMFNVYNNFFAIQGVTLDISEQTSGGYETDVGIVNANLSDEGWFDDVKVNGRRKRYQNGTKNGHRFTWSTKAADSTSNIVCRRVRIDDGEVWTGSYGVDSDKDQHCQGFNSSPDHVGYGVYYKCRCEDWGDNGFYLTNSKGENIVVDSEVHNVRGGAYRLGHGDKVIGGYAGQYDIFAGLNGQMITIDHATSEPESEYSNANTMAVGVKCYGRDYGKGGIWLKSSGKEAWLEKLVIDGDTDDSILVHMDDSNTGTLHMEDMWIYDATSNRSAASMVLGGGNTADVTSPFRITSEHTPDLTIKTDGTFTIDGSTKASGDYNANSTSWLTSVDPSDFPTIYVDFNE